MIAGAAIIAWAAATSVAAPAELEGKPIDHALFDANHCLIAVVPSPDDNGLAFRWGCPDKKLVTMSCVFDRTGYLGLGARFARAGWHCNRPLPALPDENGARVSDVAVSDPQGPPVWAACAVDDFGRFDERPKPYHGTDCYRAMIRMSDTVNRTGRDPHDVATEVLPPPAR